MLKTIKILLPLTGMLFNTSQIFAQTQTPDYTGTWVLNNAKSQITSWPKGMTSSVFIIKQVGNDFSLTIHHIYGDKQDTIVIRMLADGETRQVLNVFKGTLEQKEDYLQATLARKGYLDKVKYKFGENQNEFIADEVLVSDSNNHHNIWVFDRKVSN